MTQENLGWDTVESTGLIDDFDGTISNETTFGYDQKYGDNLVFILEFDDVETEDGEPVRQFYSLGKGWDTNDNGETVFNPANPKGFNKSSNYGMFIEAVKATDAMAVLMDRGKTPDHADVWHGLKFHFKRTDVTRTINKEDVTSSVLLPVEFLGEGGEEAPKKKAAPTKSDKGPNEKVLRAKVKKLAKEHDDHDAFVAAVMEEMPEVEELDDLFAEILDEDSDIFAS